MKVQFKDNTGFGTKYTYLIKGDPENLTKIVNNSPLYFPGSKVEQNKFVISATDSSSFLKEEVKQHLNDFRKLCAEQKVNFTRIRFPFKSLFKIIINK